MYHSLSVVKQEIERARETGKPLELCKISLFASDAYWLVRQVETLEKISEGMREAQARKERGIKDHVR